MTFTLNDLSTNSSFKKTFFAHNYFDKWILFTWIQRRKKKKNWKPHFYSWTLNSFIYLKIFNGNGRNLKIYILEKKKHRKARNDDRPSSLMDNSTIFNLWIKLKLKNKIYSSTKNSLLFISTFLRMHESIWWKIDK